MVFANEMLIPTTNFVQTIGENRRDISLNELIDLQIMYGVSVNVMMMKAKELNVITESRCRNYYIKKNSNPNFKELVENSRFEEKTGTIYEFGLEGCGKLYYINFPSSNFIE